MNKKISIIIPAYNCERTITRAVESVLRQNVDLEIIIIDDKSSDNTLRVLGELNDSRIKIVKLNSNHGVSFARNTGIKKATGDYIMFFDADDYLEQDALEIMMREIDYADLVFCGYRTVACSGEVLKEYPLPQKRWRSNDSAKMFFKYMDYGVTMMSSWGIIFKKDVIKSLSFNTEIKNSEDFSFMIDLFSSRSLDIKTIDFIGYNYTREPGVRKYRTNSVDDHLLTMNNLIEYAKKEKYYNKLQDRISCLMISQIASDLVTLSQSNESLHVKLSSFKKVKKDRVFMSMPIGGNFPIKRRFFILLIKRNTVMAYILTNFIR